jgi:hypothetical protein
MSIKEELVAGPQSPKEVLGKLADLFARQGIDVDEIGQIQLVSLYQSLTKNEDGEAEIHDLAGVQFKFSPKWESGPEWPVVQQGPAIKLPTPKVTKKKSTGFKTCVVPPDIQIGYYRNREGLLEATHD